MFNNETLNVKQFRGQGFMTVSKFAPSGNLLFIADKDSKYVSLISTSTNQLVGTYNGHNGVIWHLDISSDSNYMITCSGDMYCIIWDVNKVANIRVKNHTLNFTNQPRIFHMKAYQPL